MSLKDLCIIILLFTPSLLLAQATKSDKEIIFLKVKEASSGSFNSETGMNSGVSFPSYSFRVGREGSFQGVGFNGSKLRPYLSGNPKALAELDKFRSKRNFMITGVGLLIGGGIYVASNGVTEGTGSYTRDYQGGTLDPVEKQEITSSGIFGISLIVGGLIITAVNGIGATKHVVNAVELYNSNISKTNSSINLNISPTINLNLVGAKVSLDFY
jgi:hypothetical protein